MLTRPFVVIEEDAIRNIQQDVMDLLYLRLACSHVNWTILQQSSVSALEELLVKASMERCRTVVISSHISFGVYGPVLYEYEMGVVDGVMWCVAASFIQLNHMHPLICAYTMLPKREIYFLKRFVFSACDDEGMLLFVPLGSIDDSLSSHWRCGLNVSIILHKITEEMVDIYNPIALNHIKFVTNIGLPVVDPLPVVSQVLDRGTIMDIVAYASTSGCNSTNIIHSSSIPLFRAPLWVTDFNDINVLSECFPVIIKTRQACGRVASHLMTVCHNMIEVTLAVQTLLSNGPLIFQEYIRREDFYFKCYVIGGTLVGIVTKKAAAKTAQSFDSQTLSQTVPTILSTHHSIHSSYKESLATVATILFQSFHLSFFGFDAVIDANASFVIIDVNYFPNFSEIENLSVLVKECVLSKTKEII